MSLHYDNFEAALRRALAPAAPEDLHVAFCGLYCVSPETARGAFDARVLEIHGAAVEADAACRASFELLLDKTVRGLTEGRMAFELLLPGDDHDLVERADSLSSWCQGFLFGMTLGGRDDLTTLPAFAREVVDDLVEITRAGFDSEQDIEVAENAYAELVEYVRVGVQLVYEELNAPSSENTLSASRLH